MQWIVSVFYDLQKFEVDWCQFALHLRRFLFMPQIFSHGFWSTFWRCFECWYLAVVVKFINLFVYVVQLDPCLSCKCCNFSLARRLSALNRLVMTFVKLGHCMVSSVRSCEFKFQMSTNSNWISVSRSESLLCWSAIFVGVGIIIAVLVFDQWVSSFPTSSHLSGFVWNWSLTPYTHRSPYSSVNVFLIFFNFSNYSCIFPVRISHNAT